MSKQTIGVVFGSRSVEHDVSVVTATQVMKALDPAKYEVIPLYITRDGHWYTGDNLKTLRNFNIDDIANLAGTQECVFSSSTNFTGIITPPIAGRFSKSTFRQIDVLFPCVHGSHGEDGTLQGLFEMVDIPYVGAGVLTSAIANDKAMTKTVLKASGVRVIDEFVEISRSEWKTKRESLLAKIDKVTGFPAFVKPTTLGSSIGVAYAASQEEAIRHIDIALNMDSRVLVEKSVEGESIIEVNCAVMGYENIVASTLEKPNTSGVFQDFDTKYLKGQKQGLGMKGQDREVPAPISDDLTERIQESAVKAFQAIRGTGTARMDFIVNADSGLFWLNEINTMPGSLAFYLWEPQGMAASAVCDELIRIAKDVHAQKQATTYNYKTQLISLAASRGSKGSKNKL